MTDYTLVSQALAQWPEPPTATSTGTAGRLLSALRKQSSAPETVGPGDIAGLVGQVAREAYYQAPQQQPPRLRVPLANAWPTEGSWRRHGFEVTPGLSGWITIRPQPWQPTWLPGADKEDPFAAALKREKPSTSARVTGDPVWQELLGQSHYLSPGQRDAVRAALLLRPGRTLVVVLPTGGGKTSVAHDPALLDAHRAGSTTLLVVPTVALALDQERRAVEMFSRAQIRGAPSDFAYHSGLEPEQKQAIRRRIGEGGQPLVIASPEAVVQGLRPALLRCAQRGGLRAIVIDEAHLVSQWGNEFRPDFQALAGIRRLLVDESPKGSAPRTILLTATLTQDAWRTLRVLFGTPELSVVAAVHLRPEPSYWVAPAPDATTRIARISEALRFAPRPLILYTTTREDTDAWHDRLREGGLRRVGKIHGRTPSHDRARALEAWSISETDVMVATSAFGLGMDKADVRTVVHACVPESLDRYYQEVGRGGRDGRACVSLLVHIPQDLDTARSLNKESLVGVAKGLQRWKHMFANATRLEGTDRHVVALNAQAPHIHGDSDANVAWNLRTLILMARAGLIELDAPAPPRIDQLEGETEGDLEARQRHAFDNYRLSAVVRPTGLDHLSKATWDSVVQPARQETLEADKQNMVLIERFLAGKDELAALLVKAYTINADGVHIVPEPAAGRCPVARAAGHTRGRLLIPDAYISLDAPSQLANRLSALLSRRGASLVAIPPQASDTIQRWRKSMTSVLRTLVAQGIREIRAKKEWLTISEYRTLYRNTDARIVFHTPLENFGASNIDELPVPRVTVFEGGPGILDILVDVANSARPADILFMPEDTPDPTRPDRLLLAVRDHIRFDQLVQELD